MLGADDLRDGSHDGEIERLKERLFEAEIDLGFRRMDCRRKVEARDPGPRFSTVQGRLDILESERRKIAVKVNAMRGSVELFYIPAGSHVTTAEGREVPLAVDEGAARAVELQRWCILSRGQLPYFDFSHKDDAVAFWPLKFYWRDGPRPGVYARGEWSACGLARRHEFSSFSPRFFIDRRDRPARVTCWTTYPGANMGGLTNHPGFPGMFLPHD
jgi:hypothetical protein